ncbi:MAG: GGDEF domain-containing phosphodiesterase [Bacillota bacterium]|nr:GGDEF domain-containing phosphodiesterase [Bacillota bacterium]
MIYVIGYEVSALIFLLVVTVHFLSKPQFPSVQNRYFLIFLICGLLDISLDILGSIAISYAHNLPIGLIYVVNTVFYALQCAFPAMLLIYVWILTGNFVFSDLWRLSLWLLPLIIGEILLMGNYWTGWFFGFDDDGQYIRGLGYTLLYVATGFYVAVTFIYIHVQKRKLSTTQYRTVLAFLLLVLTALLLQYLFPHVLLTGVAIALAFTMMYFTFQNPGELLDAMTGVFNRSGMMLFIQDQLLKRQPFQVTVLAIDEMRKLNTLFGIPAGNEAICRVADYLQHVNVRSYIFRLAGDQFAVITFSAEDCRLLREEAQQRFSEPWSLLGVDVMLSCCICYIDCDDNIENEMQVLSHIESAVPLAKSRGKGTVLEIDASTLSQAQREFSIEQELREAVENDGLEVYLQPIYSMRENRFTSAEALLRFFHPTLGMIPPDQFIPMAEKSGLIVKIDELVLQRVCRWLREYDLCAAYGLDNIEINLSAVDFLQDKLAEKVIATIEKQRVDAQQLVFEITETAATVSHQALTRTMMKMCRRGVSFALDDFGTGYANITQVVHLPFALVKLDRSMLVSSMQSGSSAIVFEDTVSMIQHLGLKTVVEGVETQEQAEMLRSLGVDYVQGYCFARPQKFEDFLELMEQQRAALQAAEPQLLAGRAAE